MANTVTQQDIDASCSKPDPSTKVSVLSWRWFYLPWIVEEFGRKRFSIGWYFREKKFCIRPPLQSCDSDRPSDLSKHQETIKSLSLKSLSN